jgi:methionyl-tRNA synthetase
MFPAMLMAHGDYVLPDNVPANEFLNLEGNKLSTSKNYAVWLEDYVEKYEIDPLRYYLATIAPETKDSDFSWQEYLTRNNSELADILGNFINRTLAFTNQRFDGTVPLRGELEQIDNDMLQVIAEAPAKVGELIEKFELRKALTTFMDVARAANKYFNDTEPWKTVKEDPDRCATSLNICLQACNTLAVLMEPVLPFSAEKAWAMMGHDTDVHDQPWDDVSKMELTAKHKLGDTTILFRKMEEKEIQPEIDRLQQIQENLNADAPAEEPEEKEEARISFDDLAKVQLRVAKVLHAEPVPKTDKLLKLQIQIGKEHRQIIAGVALKYSPDELVGKKIIVVANLQPATIRGIESNGMLLAAEDDDGNFSLLGLDKDVNDGAGIR